MKKVLIFVGLILGVVGLLLVLPKKNTETSITDVYEMFKSEITQDMTLDELIETFEDMSAIPVDNVPQTEDLILYEVGTFSFTGEPMVYFSLTRQVPSPSGEFFQLHLDIQYTPNNTNRSLEECVWNDVITENIFDYVHASEAYETLIHEPIKNVEVYLDET